ncbi:MAG: hypothetical protein ACYCYK_06020 [Candidatus Dormibacteria bacterium]
MPEVIVSFLDGESVYGEVPILHLDDPFLEVELHTLDGNARQALVPASSVRQIEARQVPPLEAGQRPEDMPRVALHFLDGEVFRAQVVNPATLQRFGAIWDVVEAGREERRLIAIPYTAIKAAFYVRHWDTRRPEEREGPDSDPERRRLAEMQARIRRAGFPGPAQHKSGLLDRVGRSEGEAGPPQWDAAAESER